MKQKAMETKLVVRPLVGCLTHTHFWEGPCRAGRREDMTEEAEAKAADEVFKSSVKAGIAFGAHLNMSQMSHCVCCRSRADISSFNISDHYPEQEKTLQEKVRESFRIFQ